MDSQSTDWEVSARLRRGAWLMRAHVVEVKAARLAEIVRATKFDPNQPRVPRGNSDGGQWTDAGGGGGGITGNASSDTLSGAEGGDSFEGPKVPKERPPLARIRNAIVKQLVAFGARAAAEQLAGEPAGLVIAIADAAWVTAEYGPYIVSYFNAPKTLEELQAAVNEFAKRI